MDEPIDPVALGLKRGPRGAVGVVLLLVAIPLAFVAMRSVERPPVEPAPVPSIEAPVASPATPPVPKRARLKQLQKKAPVSRESPSVPARVAAEAPLSASADTVVPQAALVRAPVAEAAPAAAEVLERESLSPPTAARLTEEEEPPAQSASAPPPAPQPGPAETALPERDGNGEAIARAIAAEKRAAVRGCFESELKHSPKLHGTVVVELDLAPPNRVNGVRVNDDLERAAFTSCVAATMRDVRFAALDEEISVSVPYVLTPAAK